MTKGNSLSAVLCFCGFRADCLESKLTSDKELFEEFVLSSFILHSQFVVHVCFFGPHFGKLDFGRLLGLLAGGFPCVPLTCFVNSGLVLVVMVEGCSLNHFGHLCLAYFPGPDLDSSLVFWVAQCCLYLAPTQKLLR